MPALLQELHCALSLSCLYYNLSDIAQGLPEEAAFLSDLHKERERRKTPWLRSLSVSAWDDNGRDGHRLHAAAPAIVDAGSPKGGSDDGLASSPTRSAARPIAGSRPGLPEGEAAPPMRIGSAPSMFRCMPINHRKVRPVSRSPGYSFEVAADKMLGAAARGSASQLESNCCRKL